MSLGRNLLRYWRAASHEDGIPKREGDYVPNRTTQETSVAKSVHVLGGSRYGIRHTVFFFARSPEAPKTTMTVLSLSSIELRSHTQVSKFLGPTGSLHVQACFGPGTVPIGDSCENWNEMNRPSEMKHAPNVVQAN